MAKIGPTYDVNEVYVKIPDCNSKMEELLTIIRNLSSEIVNKEKVPDIVSDLSGGFTPSSDTPSEDIVNPYASMITNYLYPSDFRMVITLDDFMEQYRRKHPSNKGTFELDEMPDNNGDGEPDSDDILEEESDESEEISPTSPYGKYLTTVREIIELGLPALFLGFHGPCQGYTWPVEIEVPHNWWTDENESKIQTTKIETMKPHTHPEWDLIINLEYYHEFIEEAAKNNWDKWDRMQILLANLFEIPYNGWRPKDEIIKF